MMVCIACISNVNQPGSISYCHVMAEHLQGNRGRVFVYNLWIFKMPISSSQVLEINKGIQQKAFLCIAVQKVDILPSDWLSVLGRLNLGKQNWFAT